MDFFDQNQLPAGKEAKRPQGIMKKNEANNGFFPFP